MLELLNYFENNEIISIGYRQWTETLLIEVCRSDFGYLIEGNNFFHKYEMKQNEWLHINQIINYV